jgi:hypothetical protein
MDCPSFFFMKNYSVLIKCGTTSPEQLASVLTRMKFYPDDYRYTLAKLLQGCDAIIDQSAEPIPDEALQENPCHTPNTDPDYCFECLRVSSFLRTFDGRKICESCCRVKFPGEWESLTP